MGLSVSYDAYDGSYSLFDAFRTKLASLVGINLNQMEGFGGVTSWTPYEHDGICALLNHSDCEGQIEAEKLEALGSRLRELVATKPDGPCGKRPSWHAMANRFAEACECAAAVGHPLVFD